MKLEKKENILKKENTLKEISNQLNYKNKFFSLFFLWDDNYIEVKKQIYIDDENHKEEAKAIIKIIDCILESTRHIYQKNGCLLNNDPYDDLKDAFKIIPILEMNALFMKQKESIEFEYSVYNGTINDVDTIIVESTIEQEEIPAPIVLYVLIDYLKNIYNIKTLENIEEFINYLKQMR